VVGALSASVNSGCFGAWMVRITGVEANPSK